MFEHSNSQNWGVFFSNLFSYMNIFRYFRTYLFVSQFQKCHAVIWLWFDCDSSGKLSRIVFLYLRTFRKINEWCPKHHTSFQIGEGSLFLFRSPNNPVSAWLVIYYGWEQIKGLVLNKSLSTIFWYSKPNRYVYNPDV